MKPPSGIDGQMAACRKAGIEIYAMADLILFPKTLVEKYGMQKTMGDPVDPQTEKYLRLLMDQMFERFPDLDGLVVRIGETYLQDAPFHQGKIARKTDADRTIIPLVNILRDEICVKHNKKLVFRTWYSFDVDLKTYLKVSDAVEPHPNLAFSVKHCEGDFHRSNSFSTIMGRDAIPRSSRCSAPGNTKGRGPIPTTSPRA